MKTFTEVEKTIARNIDWEYRWMARDRDGNLCIYEEEPKAFEIALLKEKIKGKYREIEQLKARITDLEKSLKEE